MSDNLWQRVHDEAMHDYDPEPDWDRPSLADEAEPLPDEECPAGGVHVWAVQEEAGTGRTGVACDECGASPTRRGAPE